VGYRRLFIWVEGSGDVEFFNRVIKPIFEERYDWVEVRAYAQETSDYIIEFIKSIRRMEADYIFVADINLAPCITDRKQRLHKTFKNIETDKTIVVVREIESWYLAGLSDKTSKKLGLPIFSTTDSLIKEQFDPLIPKKFDSRIDFMLEILNHFSIETAKQKNSSFNYFAQKYQLEINR